MGKLSCFAILDNFLSESTLKIGDEVKNDIMFQITFNEYFPPENENSDWFHKRLCSGQEAYPLH
jgi:hypothetical protein